MEFKTVKYDIDIPEVEPFKNCKLGREDFAKNLTSLLQNSSETSLTLALDGAWGMGKTTFLQMLKKHLILNNIPTIYFSAWESDYNNEPLLAIIAEFDKQLTEQTAVIETGKSIIDKLKSILETASTHILTALLKVSASLTLKTLGLEEIGRKVIEDISDAERAKRLIKAYEESTQNVRSFKENLHEVVQLLGEINRKPIVIIIDELDRCKPLYSIQVLEIVKHFFDIEGITFILSADYAQLKESIKHCYGVDFDANSYTHKFFDYYFTLDIEKSRRALINYIFEQQWPRQLDTKNVIDKSVSVVLGYSKEQPLSIRDIQQIANLCKLIYISCDKELYDHFSYFIVYSAVERHKNGKFYKLLLKVLHSFSNSERIYIPQDLVNDIVSSIRLTSFPSSEVQKLIEVFLCNDKDLATRRSKYIQNHYFHDDEMGELLHFIDSFYGDRFKLYLNLIKVLSILDYV